MGCTVQVFVLFGFKVNLVNWIKLKLREVTVPDIELRNTLQSAEEESDVRLS